MPRLTSPNIPTANLHLPTSTTPSESSPKARSKMWSTSWFMSLLRHGWNIITLCIGLKTFDSIATITFFVCSRDLESEIANRITYNICTGPDHYVSITEIINTTRQSIKSLMQILTRQPTTTLQKVISNLAAKCCRPLNIISWGTGLKTIESITVINFGNKYS